MRAWSWRRVAAALALLLAAAALLAASSSLANDDGVPSTYGVPARREGDQGLYRIDHVPPSNATPSPGAPLDWGFEVPAPAIAFDSQGAPYHSLPLRETWREQGDDGPDDLEQWWLDSFDNGVRPGAQEALTNAWWWQGIRCSGICANVLIGGNNGLVRIDGQRAETTYGENLGLCGLRNGLQGTRLALDRPVAFHGDCLEPTLRAIGSSRLGDRQVIVFAPAGRGDELQVWMTKELAYPVRVWMGSGNGTGMAYTLEGFLRGADVPAQAGADSLPPASPSARLGPRGALGPDASGLPMPFPLEQAVARARADDSGAGLDGYLARDPGAQVAAARFGERSNGDWRLRIWDVHFTGATPYSVRITFGEPEEGRPSAVAPLYSTDPLAAANGELQVEALESPAGLPPRDRLPASLPTVASAVERYEAVRPADWGDKPANAWAFAVTCPDPACTTVDSWVGAGHDRLSSTQAGSLQSITPVLPPPPIVADILLVAIAPDGQTAFAERIHQVRSTTGASGLAAQPGADEPVEAAPRLSSTGDWGQPGPWVAAGTGVALAVVAIAVAIDALRHGGVGLFSRITASQLPEHPVRSRLLAAVSADPGIHFSELVRRLDLAPGAAQHHLRKLADGELVKAVTHGSHTRYFPAGTGARLTALAQALRAEGAAPLLSVVRQRPGVSVSDLAAALGRTPGTVSHHLDRLQAAGLLERRRDGRRVGIHPTALAMDPEVAALAAS